MARPVVGNRFSVSIGPIMMSFSKIKNISRDIEVDVLKEGGVNDYVHVLQKQYTTPHKLVFEHGLCESSMLSMLTPLLVGKILPFSGTINVRDAKGETVSSYSFGEPIVLLKWEIGDLDALGNKVLIESLEVAHSGISVDKIGALMGIFF
jgi:phage tail-like protein